MKVVDRRWWANSRTAAACGPRGASSLKPTYVEELEQQLAEKDEQPRNTSPSTGRRRASSRRRGCGCGARSRRTSSARAATCSPSCSRSSTTSIAPSTPRGQSAVARSAAQGVEMVRRQFLAQARRPRREAASTPTGQPFDPQLHEAITTVPGRIARAGRHRRRRRPARLPHRRRRAAAGRRSRSARR